MNVKMVSVPNAENILKFQKCKETISRLGVKVEKPWLKIAKCYVLTATDVKATINFYHTKKRSLFWPALLGRRCRLPILRALLNSGGAFLPWRGLFVSKFLRNFAVCFLI